MLKFKQASLIAMATTLVASSATFGQNRLPGATEGTEVSVKSDATMWITGVNIESTDAVKEIGVAGARYIIDMRTIDAAQIKRYLTKHTKHDLGLCLTLRWVDQNGNGSYDKAPSRPEAQAKMNTLLSALNSPEAKKLGDKLWIQFFNEVGDGPGTLRPADVDTMLEIATEGVTQLRKFLPQVKVCGPALSQVSDLRTARNQAAQANRDQYDTTMKAVKWAVAHADAIDLHLRVKGAADAKKELIGLDTAIKQIASDASLDIVVFEWNLSGATFENDRALARAHFEVFGAMANHGVKIAAYAGYMPSEMRKDQASVSLVNAKGEPREPYYRVISTLAQRGAGPRKLDRPIGIEVDR